MEVTVLRWRAQSQQNVGARFATDWEKEGKVRAQADKTDASRSGDPDLEKDGGRRVEKSEEPDAEPKSCPSAAMGSFQGAGGVCCKQRTRNTATRVEKGCAGRDGGEIDPCPRTTSLAGSRTGTPPFPPPRHLLRTRRYPNHHQFRGDKTLNPIFPINPSLARPFPESVYNRYKSRRARNPNTIPILFSIRRVRLLVKQSYECPGAHSRLSCPFCPPCHPSCPCGLSLRFGHPLYRQS